MNNKTALITGASSGFGLLTTIELCRLGFSVIATMRDLKNKETVIKLCKQEEVNAPTEFLQLDLTNQESIDNLRKYLKSSKPIDVLINNAGFALGGFSEEITIEEYKEQFETNFFGTIAITNAILPTMRERREGKIINISSISGLIGFPALSPYVASKHALEGWSESLRLELKPFGIEVLLIEPGSFQTKIWTKGKKIAAKSQLSSSPYYTFKLAVEKEMENGSMKYGDPIKVAQLIAKLSSQEKNKKFRYPIGKGVKAASLLKAIIPWALWEKIILKKLNV